MESGKTTAFDMNGPPGIKSESQLAINMGGKRKKSKMAEGCEVLSNFFVPKTLLLNNRQKKFQLVKSLVLALIPVALLLAENIYLLVEANGTIYQQDLAHSITDFNMNAMKFIGRLQAERTAITFYLASVDFSQLYAYANEALYFSTRGTDTLFASLITTYGIDSGIVRNLNGTYYAVLATRNKIIQYQNVTSYDGMTMYTNIIEAALNGLPSYTSVSDVGSVWRSLVAYKNLYLSIEATEYIAASGVAYFCGGGFNSLQILQFVNNYAFAYDFIDLTLKFDDSMSAIFAQISNESYIAPYTNTLNLILLNNLTSPDFATCLYWKQLTEIYYIDLSNDLMNVAGNNILESTSMAAINNLPLPVTIIVVVFFVGAFVTFVTTKINRRMQTIAEQGFEQFELFCVERRRTEHLLFQMLPISVAKRLIEGEPVVPEYFERATLYFSDIPGWQRIILKSTPLQVVKLLNRTYETFDKCIERYDVYKVETIGDTYMVSSGAPSRNGTRHYFEIAMMACELLETVAEIELSHLQGERLCLRVGINSGPLTAGVVGFKMPRYCFFGDTVNTASRMESTGMASKIQITSATYAGLTNDQDVNYQKYGALFKLESRGIIDVKGKGQMQTYWLEKTPILADSEDSPDLTKV